MAQRAVDQGMYERIDQSLGYRGDRWSDLPWWLERWPELDGLDKKVSHREWAGIAEQRLAELQDRANEGPLTLEQSARYNELARLVDEWRPAQRVLFDDDTASIPGLLDASGR